MKTSGVWIILGLLTIGSTCFAQSQDSGFVSPWSIEGSVQAHSVAGAASPWLGIAGEYRLLDPINLGLRGYVPMSRTVDQSTYSIQGFLRARAIHGSYTDVFVEPEYAENFYNFVGFQSFGASVGVLNHVTPGLSVGVAGGIETARAVLDSVGLEDRADYVVYPKVGVIANFNF